MKLWLKVSLVSVIMVTAALSILSLLILIGAGKSNLDYAIQSAVSTHAANAVYFEKAMQASADDTISATTKRSLARYYASSLADPNIMLTAADDVIYNTTTIDPALYLPLETQEKQYVITDIGEKSMLIVGNRISVRGVDYSFYRMTDVTSIYTDLLALSYRFFVDFLPGDPLYRRPDHPAGTDDSPPHTKAEGKHLSHRCRRV